MISSMQYKLCQQVKHISCELSDQPSSLAGALRNRTGLMIGSGHQGLRFTRSRRSVQQAINGQGRRDIEGGLDKIE